jgi:ubiquinol-cytochrome c reductase cytochrome b subunit
MTTTGRPPGPATPADQPPEPEVYRGGWTGALRRKTVATFPPEKLLPDTQPAYVSSWIYVFGVLTLSALVVVIASGCVLSLEGPSWWHTSSVGHYVNSTHLWSVQLFMAFMVIHLWGKFWMAAWRGKRALTWITGAIAFLASIGTAFTGYDIQQNFDSQWITTQAKDGLNSVGIGAYFNVLDFGQMLMWHIVLLPIAVGAIVVLHILLVRKHGVVPPLPVRGHPQAQREHPQAEPVPPTEEPTP